MVTASQRRGFTLIEVLVVVAVVGLLVALLLPAVQSVREAARRTQCVNHLRQIGLAIEGHVSAFGTYPSGNSSPYATGSFYFPILPFMEQGPLYNSINLVDKSVHFLVNNNNTTALNLMPATLLCPSEPVGPRGTYDRTNYAGNAGSTPDQCVFCQEIAPPPSPRDITDGLSQTVGVAEWRAGSGVQNRPDRLGSTFLFIDAGTDLIRECEAVDPATARVSQWEKGLFWLGSGLGCTQYTHLLPPNRPSCARAQNYLSATTSGSYHPGGVDTLALDGSVHFVKDSIDRRVWSAYGTRGAGDSVDQSSFQ